MEAAAARAWDLATARCRDFVADVQAMGVPVLLVLTKDDRIVGELKDPTSEDVHEHRQRLMKRARRSLGFEGVHVHYSTNNDLPVSRKARRRLLRYIESIVASGTREECAVLLDEIAQKSFSKL